MLGMHTTEQALGAIPNGSVVAKTNTKPGDGHQDGDRGKVIGSVAVDGRYLYFVEWDDAKGLAVGLEGSRIRKV